MTVVCVPCSLGSGRWTLENFTWDDRLVNVASRLLLPPIRSIAGVQHFGYPGAARAVFRSDDAAPSSSSSLLSSLELSDTKIYGSQIRTLRGTASHVMEQLRVRPAGADASP